MSLPRLTYPGNLIVSKRENIYYLTGLKQVHPVNREALLFITPDQTLLYHSAFLTPPPHLNSIAMSANQPLESVLKNIFTNPDPIAFEAHNLTYAEYQRIQTTLPHATLSPTTDLIETARLIKDRREIQAIQKACSITRRTMSWLTEDPGSETKRSWILGDLDPGSNLTEIDLARKIENHLYDLGANSLAFPPIVAFDQNAALPHHLPDKTTLKPNSVVLLDFGCQIDGYCSDMSRTICVGTPPPYFLEIENIVQSAYAAGLALLRQHFSVTELTGDRSRIEIKDPGSVLRLRRDPGSIITASTLDKCVRAVIAKAGYSQEFIHTSGHGLGLEIHEQPSLNSHNQIELKPGMVITLEPGIYLPGKFGYRHEHTLFLS